MCNDEIQNFIFIFSLGLQFLIEYVPALYIFLISYLKLLNPTINPHLGSDTLKQPRNMHTSSQST